MTAKQFIEEQIPQMNGPEKVYEFFKGLGYDTLSLSYQGKDAFGLKAKDKEFVNKIYAISNYDKRFQIFLVELKSFSRHLLKSLPLYFENEIQYPLLVITLDYQYYSFILVEKIREGTGTFKRKIIKLVLNRENAFYTDKFILSNSAVDPKLKDPNKIYKNLLEAFNVEKVSELFFNDYKDAFFSIREFVSKQDISIKESHEFSQQLLNRIMFIYFIDKKKWMKNSPKFMKWFWQSYLKEKKKKSVKPDTFYKLWLKVLFLEAFNKRFSQPSYLPTDIKDALQMAPYLNGGLFKKNRLDELLIEIPDNKMEDIFNFFEKYNFTIREDLPLDVEVAVDPEMIGYVYESLSNVAEEIYERQDLGIFYTPRIEVDFMCRRAIVEYLIKNTDIPKEIIYRFVFDSDKSKIEEELDQSIYEKLEEALEQLSIIDPACGSGAFLVGMTNILAELLRIIYKHLNRELTNYQLKKRIIGNNLYGVDVMPWAVHSAELRLWLSLMIESDLKVEDLQLEPLLPNLTLKLRIGDSLVQELGDINLDVRSEIASRGIKSKLTTLKHEKEKFYNNDRTAKFKNEKNIIEYELKLFQDIINERILNLEKEKQSLIIDKPEQTRMVNIKNEQTNLLNNKKVKEQDEKEKQRIDLDIQKLIKIKGSLSEKKPFIWDIDFAEIFGDKGGVDIVIGNPPYVRQEKIAPPNRLQNEITNENKREYKEKLLKSVQVHFPQIKSIDKKSDYYVYFYFHGLSLLNKTGTFCFITSNSWLDVGYGKDLQEFLLKYVPITAIYDNQVKRSFKHASVNTIIALFDSPILKKPKQSYDIKNHKAKFIMFKKPYEEVINTKNLLKINNTQELLKTDDFRVFIKPHKELLEEFWEYPEDIKEEQKETYQFHVGKYLGNKWRGQYLRAPDILHYIYKKNIDKLIQLSKVAKYDYGTKPGKVKFFYLTEQVIKEYGIEKKYIRPIINSSQDLKNIFITASNKIFFCTDSKSKLKNTGALLYITNAEKKKMNKGASVESNRPYWYSLHFENIDFLLLRFWDKRFWTPIAKIKTACSDNFFYGKFYNDQWIGNTQLNSIFYFLQIESMGRTNQGEGILNTYGYDYNFIKLIDFKYFNEEKMKSLLENIAKRSVKSIFIECGINPNKKIRQQVPSPLPDRKVLDDIIFDILGLTQEERNEVYWSVCELVKNRLDKARSA